MMLLRHVIDSLTYRQANRYNPVLAESVLSDFENSPLRFEYEVLLTEYRSLREEITIRLSNQQQIINFSIAIIAAMFAITQLLPVIRSNLIAQLLPLIYPLLSIIFSAFALMYADQDFIIADIATYINQHLRQRMQTILDKIPNTNPKVWEWDEYRSKAHYRKVMASPFYYIMSLARYLVMIIPSIGLIFIYSLSREGTDITVWELSVVVVAMLFAIWMIVTIIFLWKKFLSIA